MTRLGRFQSLILGEFEDCLKRTRRRASMDKSVDLIEFILKESSITDRDTDRAFCRVRDAIRLINRKLCTGTWCTRCHCKHYSNSNAYNCTTTEPSRCNIFKKYISDKARRENKKESEVDNEH